MKSGECCSISVYNSTTAVLEKLTSSDKRLMTEDFWTSAVGSLQW